MGSFKENFKENCLKLVSLVEITTLPPKVFSQLIIKDNIPFVKKPEFDSVFKKLIMLILDESVCIKENYTPSYLAEKISDYICSIHIEPPENIPDSIDQFYITFFKELRENITDFKIPLLIENLKLNEKITIGNVDLVPFSKVDYTTILLEQGYQPMEYFDCSEVKVTPEEEKRIGSIAVAKVTAGDNERALEKSIHLVDESLNVIRLFFCSHNFGLLGSCNNITRLYADVYNKKNKDFSSKRWDFTNLSSPCELNLEKFEKYKSQGLNNVIEILKKTECERNSMEKKLINSINWFGEVIKNRENKENLIRMFISLESLVIGINETKTENLAKRISILNHSAVNDRSNTKSFIKRMYEERGYLVHEGFTNFNESDFYNLLSESRSCIINIAKKIDTLNDFKDFKDLISREENKVL